MKPPVIAGFVALLAHSILIGYISVITWNKPESWLIWELIYTIDLPISLLLELSALRQGLLNVLNTDIAPYLFIHFFFGGVQYFCWGWLIIKLLTLLYPTTDRRGRVRQSARHLGVESQQSTKE